jgi:hypothetical protein
MHLRTATGQWRRVCEIGREGGGIMATEYYSVSGALFTTNALNWIASWLKKTREKGYHGYLSLSSHRAVGGSWCRRVQWCSTDLAACRPAAL